MSKTRLPTYETVMADLSGSVFWTDRLYWCDFIILTRGSAADTEGVTKDSVEVIAIVPNDQQVAATPAQGRPTNYTTGAAGTVTDAMTDALTAYMHVFGGKYTYGRDINMEFVTSSGSTRKRSDCGRVSSRGVRIVANTFQPWARK